MYKKYVIIRGGLGNQMSQYALYISLMKIYGDNVRLLNTCKSNEHNGLELKAIYPEIRTHFYKNILLTLLARIMSINKFYPASNGIRKILACFKISCINESYDYRFRQEVFSSSGDFIRLYLGGWHDENYFKSNEILVRESFRFDEKMLDKKNLDVLDQIQAVDSVSIHIRRGDYYKVGVDLFGGVCDDEYYNRALNLIEKNVEKPKYFIFSDEPEWVCKNFKVKNSIVINNSGAKSWIDMFLMSRCEHNIICNSSFSWWSAWLNSNLKKIVVCPKKFIKTESTTNVYPVSWTRV